MNIKEQMDAALGAVYDYIEKMANERKDIDAIELKNGNIKVYRGGDGKVSAVKYEDLINDMTYYLSKEDKRVNGSSMDEHFEATMTQEIVKMLSGVEGEYEELSYTFQNLKREENILKARKTLADSGEIKREKFYKNSFISNAVFVDLPDGERGIAAALGGEHGRQVHIKGFDGTHYGFLPEATASGDIAASICRDEENLYIGACDEQEAFLACYRMGDFKEVWKNDMVSMLPWKITVDDKQVISAAPLNKSLYYFDKKDGELIKHVEVPKAHYEISAESDVLLRIPWGTDGAGIGLPKNFGKIGAVAVDEDTRRVYIAGGGKIGVMTAEGYRGTMLLPEGTVSAIDVDKKSGALLVSVYKTDGGKTSGWVEIYSPEAIDKLLKVSRGELSVPQLRESVR